MMPETTTTSHPPPLPTAAQSNEAEGRAAELRREAEASTDRTRRALLLYEAGYLTETALGQPAQAVQHYLSSYNLDHRFRLPLYALLRMFERRRSFKNLSRLYDAELRSARSPAEKATALVDQATLAMVSQGDLEVVRACLERATETHPTAEASVLLEWNRVSAADAEGAMSALLKRADSSDDPIHRGVLLLEVAAHRERAGEHSAALEALKTAALGPRTHESFLAALARFARANNYLPELVEATERRADLVAAELKERSAESEPDQALIERLSARAVALWYEAARLRCTSLSDAEGALVCVEKALEIRPDDVLLRQTRMLAYDLKEDREKAAEEAKRLLALGIEGEHAAALHFRLAEHALVRGDSEAARLSLMEAIQQAGGSIAADAILDDLLLDEERHRERVQRREKRAEGAEGGRASRLLLEAAQIAAHDLKDVQKARELYERADALTEKSPEVAREAYGASLELLDPELTRFAIDKLLAQKLDDDERAALVHHRIDCAASDDEALALIETHLADPTFAHFLPTLALVRAAEAKRFPLLARAHELLAERAVSPDEQVAHLCAAARANLRANLTAEARSALERALSRAPGQRYAVALLEEVLRGGGEGSQVVELLRRAAEAQGKGRSAEMSLLVAGAAAEGAGNLTQAAQSYEEAADRNPESVGPLWALLRLAERNDDQELELRAREGLAQHEARINKPGIDSLLLGEHYDLVSNKPELAEHMFTEALSDEGTRANAAIALLLLRTGSPELRERAAEVLAEESVPDNAVGFLRARGISLSVRGADRAAVLDVIERVAAARSNDRWAAMARASLPLPGAPREHAVAAATFASTTSDADFAESLRSEALMANLLAGETRPLEEELRMASIPLDGALSQHAAHTVVAHASPLLDAPLRARALSVCAEHARTADARAELARAEARARVLAGEAALAVDVLTRRLEQEPDDLAALELLRVAARKAQRFELVADAAERLAEHVQGELWASLLEEAGATRMDLLDDVEGAERVLRKVMDKYPTRPIPYYRIHDLLGERNDTAQLIALVEARTELVDEAEELAPLFYELARLHRASGDLDAALDALDHLSMLEEHVGGLALAMEIHTARENWSEAVSALEALAQAEGVPLTQKRLARLAAADFYLNRLNDGDAALAQLDQLVTEGHADAALYTRIGDVAEKLGKLERAGEALLLGAELAKGELRNDLTLRAAAVFARAGQADKGVELYQRAMDARPGHVGAVRALLALTEDDAIRERALTRFETEVRAEARAQPLEPEPLRKLVVLSELRRREDIAFVALTTLVTIGAANMGERDAADAAMRRVFGARPNPKSPIGVGELRELLAPPVDERYAQLFRTLFGAAADIDRLEPGRFDVGRGQRVSPREPNQVRDEIVAMMGAFELKLGDFYVGGDEATRVVGFPRDDELAMLAGVGVTAPLSSTRRHQLALQVAGYALSSLPLLTRTSAQAARLVFAAMIAAEALLPPNVARDELGDLPRTLAKALPRKVRKALPDLVRSLPDGGTSTETQVRLLLRHTRRLALLLGGDLEAALEGVVGALPSPETIGGSDDALDLVRAFTSAAMTTLRKRLGLAR
jgi:hypothetical protein